MQKAAKNSSSPYAKPLPFVTLKKKKDKKKKAQEKRSSVSFQGDESHHDMKRHSVEYQPAYDGKRHSVASHKQGDTRAQKARSNSMPATQPAHFDVGGLSDHSDHEEDLLDDDFRPPDRMLRERRRSAVMPDEEMLVSC